MFAKFLKPVFQKSPFIFLRDLLFREFRGRSQFRGDPLLPLGVYGFDVKCWVCAWLFLNGRNTRRNNLILPAKRVTHGGSY